jgi:NADPH-dependent glutamate synthase beta subunit-like oxidoreductase
MLSIGGGDTGSDCVERQTVMVPNQSLILKFYKTSSKPSESTPWPFGLQLKLQALMKRL